MTRMRYDVQWKEKNGNCHGSNRCEIIVHDNCSDREIFDDLKRSIAIQMSIPFLNIQLLMWEKL